VLDERPEAADADADGLPVRGQSQRARQLEQLDRLGQRDRVQALTGPSDA
jgi:hypothetical protein